MKYEVVMGLETHAELDTESKLFCGCSTKFGSEPNTQTCPVCLGLPGVLPVMNKKAFEHSLKASLALNCEISNFTNFDRKSYYYPDLPKNYQVSQNYFNIGNNGYVDIVVKGKEKRIGIHNVHLEEEAGKLVHPEASGANYSLVDFNRAGVPLLEIVTQPDMRSVEEVESYMQTLRNILLYIGVSDCKMQEGSLRFEASVSLREQGANFFGKRVEIKNLNSMKAVLKAIAYEISRQSDLLDKGEDVLMETRLWDDIDSVSRRMRSKEEAHDYRYFPEPDLVPVWIDQEWIDETRTAIPELPVSKRQRFVNEYTISDYDAGILTEDRLLADYFEECVKMAQDSPKELSNWIINDVLRELNERKTSVQDFAIPPKMLVELIKIKPTIGNSIAKDVFIEMINTGKTATSIVIEKNLTQMDDVSELNDIVARVIEENPKAADDYSQGKKNALTFLIGQTMKITRGKANPKILTEIFEERLSAGSK
ncbi:MAG: glutaminyl-tRNA synthase (glutamine-hydrolyzing) subunit B [Planctomycetes bacterium GWF2_40_8]|nr:MAG: glutaminyl-tRNA synthase (glutamine-hydrolyzing) subunit B [Planctomycetes bacterium GWF2_40_8]OHB89627.1 MAG: glutaminyl-tRNA synthase (glutamine-hydrolyzing) subunit B [Planctomycetes bacterium RIFCSPHIGHO2_02_FULL_40_12]OHC02042.1 MAG: glutaminyl-tRNA synthase (glutamine-hydrolyzing) subunit B [Planctomycetes bacterium RIFCSPLOWO2_12_FULL_40_19]